MRHPNFIVDGGMLIAYLHRGVEGNSLQPVRECMLHGNAEEADFSDACIQNDGWDVTDKSLGIVEPAYGNLGNRSGDGFFIYSRGQIEFVWKACKRCAVDRNMPFNVILGNNECRADSSENGCRFDSGQEQVRISRALKLLFEHVQL